MTATVTNLPNPAPNPPAGHQVATEFANDDGLNPTSERDRRKATQLARGDLMEAARLLYVAAATFRRGAADDDQAGRVDRVRADLLAVLAGEDTPSEIEFGHLAADASAFADEVEKLREELEETRGDTRVYGKGI
jgi:hypothetical protein